MRNKISTAIKGDLKAVNAPLVETRDLFVFDLSRQNVPIPPVFYEADAIISEPAWSHGFKKFMGFEGKEARIEDWHIYCRNIDRICTVLGKPAFIFFNKQAEKWMKHATGSFLSAITNNGKLHASCILYTYGVNMPFANSEECAEYLCETYHTILDFSIGYGDYLLNAKRLIGTDVKKDCIAYVQEQRSGR